MSVAVFSCVVHVIPCADVSFHSQHDLHRQSCRSWLQLHNPGRWLLHQRNPSCGPAVLVFDAVVCRVSRAERRTALCHGRELVRAVVASMLCLAVATCNDRATVLATTSLRSGTRSTRRSPLEPASTLLVSQSVMGGSTLSVRDTCVICLLCLPSTPWDPHLSLPSRFPFCTARYGACLCRPDVQYRHGRRGPATAYSEVHGCDRVVHQARQSLGSLHTVGRNAQWY